MHIQVNLSKQNPLGTNLSKDIEMILFITLYENNVTSLEVINNFITFQGMYI
jgi:hypothetical protein